MTAQVADPEPVYAMEAIHPEVVPLRTAALARDWGAVQAHIAAQTRAEDVSVLVGYLAELDGVQHLLEPLATAPRPDRLAQLAYAHWLVLAGWDIRTGARASQVSREQFAEFHAHLRRAEQLLLDVTAREPDNLGAWTLRLTTAKGLSLGQAEALRRYRQAAKIDPHSFKAQSALLQQVCRKWGGSHERMHEFASQCAEAAPPGSLSGALVAKAHLEQWLDLPTADGRAYLAQPLVAQQARQAADRSVLHPDFRPTFGWVRAHSAFAMLFSLIGDLAAAAPHFRAMGNFASDDPWCYLGKPTESYLRHRAKALGKG